MTDASQDNLVVVFEQIKQIGREFRLQCKSGKLPRIENWLKKIPESGRENLFQNLLQQEIIYCRAEGQHPTSAPYIRRFPQYQKLIRQAFFESTQMSVTGESPSTPSKISASVGAATMEYEDIARIGDYELLCQLGQGGFGVVYQARHAQRQNIVALKVLPSGFEGEAVNADRLLRFRREFRTLSEFSHPNLVGMQSLEVDDGKWFFTMDLIDGTDFLTWVRPYDELNVRRLRDALSQLARGILALHERNIVHRDLKPGNVMVEADGTVKILDFGLVAELQGVTDQTASLRSAQFAGTPKYAAPEQMFGERSEASDWYALGVMLYEALTGEAPFAGNQMEILQKKQSQDPALLFGREGIPEDLAQLADALLRRKSEDRLTATDIVDKLQLDLETRVIGSTRAGQDSGGSAGSMD